MVKPNLTPEIYRCTNYCKNCPFKDNGKAIHLEEGRVDQIKATLLKSDNESFNCHKTAYNLDEDMNPTLPQKLKMCYGAYLYLKEQNKPNLQMKLATHLGME